MTVKSQVICRARCQLMSYKLKAEREITCFPLRGLREAAVGWAVLAGCTCAPAGQCWLYQGQRGSRRDDGQVPPAQPCPGGGPEEPDSSAPTPMERVEVHIAQRERKNGPMLSETGTSLLVPAAREMRQCERKGGPGNSSFSWSAQRVRMGRLAHPACKDATLCPGQPLPRPCWEVSQSQAPWRGSRT